MVADPKNIRQVPMHLHPLSPYSAQYFVCHSGVASAMATIEASIEELERDSSLFRMFYIYGPRGVGKTHLLFYFKEQAEIRGFPINTADGPDASQAGIRKFIDSYENSRKEGGLLLVAAKEEPLQAFANPHSGSRLRAATALRLNYPKEEELEPLILSIAERNNIRLTDRMREFLLKRLPLQPLSFDNILARVSELSMIEGRPVTEGIFREAVLENLSREKNS